MRNAELLQTFATFDQISFVNYDKRLKRVKSNSKRLQNKYFMAAKIVRRRRKIAKKSRILPTLPSDTPVSGDSTATVEGAMDDTDEKQHEMMELMHSVIREEINAAVDKLQPQLNSIREELKVCFVKVTNIEQSLSDMEDRVTSLERSNRLLQQVNKDLRIKAERQEEHSCKFNLRVLGLN